VDESPDFESRPFLIKVTFAAREKWRRSIAARTHELPSPNSIVFLRLTRLPKARR
jgi:hypothetical protein